MAAVGDHVGLHERRGRLLGNNLQTIRNACKRRELESFLPYLVYAPVSGRLSNGEHVLGAGHRRQHGRHDVRPRCGLSENHEIGKIETATIDRAAHESKQPAWIQTWKLARHLYPCVVNSIG